MLAAKRIPLGLGLMAFAVAFLQRPGEASSDTKIDLHVDPGGFLADVASLWSATGDLGHVQGGQYAGYLLPMGPFFALGDALGLSAWVTHRLWLGLVLAVAAWGMVRLLDEVYERDRGAAHLVAGALIVLNPYVVTFANRTSVTLLAYAALPWLLLAAARGSRTARGWWWPLFFGVAVSLTAGGVNAAVTGFVLVGPALLLVYQWRVLGVPGGHVWGFAWRAAVAVVATSLWWIVPVALHAGYGLDFLPFTESAGAIWGTTSLTESLRLMGYWISYLGVGYGNAPVPYFTNVEPLLFAAPVVAATLLVPGLALAGLVWTGRRSYAPFFLLLLLVGLLAMSLGFPEGTPLRRLVNGVYHDFDPVQFLRTTYKAGPLVVVSVAWLGGVAAAAAWQRLRGRGARLATTAAVGALLALAAWPLATGRAVDAIVTWDRIPAYWEDAADDLDRELPEDSRALVLPGQLYAFYEWGATIDPILPALTERRVAAAGVPPYADLRAVDLLWTVDALVRQRRLVPGQLVPLLRLMGAGAVVTGTDDDRVRSGAPDPAAAAEALRDQGLGEPARSYGEPERFEAPPEDAVAPATMPPVRRYDVEGARAGVRVEPARGATVVDGSAEGLAALAAFGALPDRGAVLYAADRTPAQIHAAASQGGALVVTDSNRKRVIVPSRPRQSVGATLAPGDDPPDNAAVLDPFPDAGEDARAVAVLDGARFVRAPFSPGFPQFPEHRPYAALDGDPDTYWLADAQLRRHRHRLEVTLDYPVPIPHLDLLPQRHGLTDVTAVEVNGRRFDVRPGWNRLPVRSGPTERVTVRIAAVRRPKGFARGPGAIAELRIPGVQVRERLRPPTRIEEVARTYGLDNPLSYVFSRASGDDPFRRSPEIATAWRGAGLEDQPIEAALVARPGDAERHLERTIAPPFARSYRPRAWLALAPDAPDPVLDRLAGSAGETRFDSSGRLHGLARHRASRAFDGDPRTGWAMHADPGPHAWVGWRGAGRGKLTRLQLRGLPGVALPTRVRVRGPRGEAGAPTAVARDGTVRLARPVPARAARIEVVSAPDGATVVGFSEVYGAGVPRAARGGTERVRGRCGDAWMEAGGRRLPLVPRGRVAALDDGRPLRAASCAGELALPGGRQDLRTGGRAFLIEHLLLESLEPRARAAAPGRVVDPGNAGRGRQDDVRLELEEPAWLVLGQSYNRGWRAWCDGESLGEPTPIDGYANGWLAPAGCREARFDFGPNRYVKAGYVGSGALLALAVLFLLIRRPPAPRRQVPRELERHPSTHRLAPGHAALAALATAMVVAGLFGLRAGAIAAPVLALILWRGVGMRTLVLGASLLLVVVVPLVYVLFPVENREGFNPAYAVEKVEAHWVAVAAWVLLALALWRILSTASRRSGARAAGSAASGAGGGEP